MMFVILRAEAKDGGQIKTALVEAENFDGDAASYFTSRFGDAKKIGEVEVEGDTDVLDGIYLSD